MNLATLTWQAHALFGRFPTLTLIDGLSLASLLTSMIASCRLKLY